MVTSIRHRGPDDRGHYVQKNVGFGHARLSIQDLSPAGHQPMTSACGRYVIVYNGEIYNTADLRRQLQSVRFRGHSDTEVLLELYARIGDAVFAMLNGMFAFAIHDRQKQTVTLVRDRFGIKPLYVSQESATFRFGSEVKALYAGGLEDRRINRAHIHEFMYYGTVLGRSTMFATVEQVLPGEKLVLNVASGTSERASYVQPFMGGSIESSVSEAKDRVRQLLNDSVDRHLVADVPVAAFLSGGIDSSAITAFAAKKLGASLTTYAVGFDAQNGIDELPKARLVAEMFGTDHHELHVTISNVKATLEKLGECHDLPFSDAANIPLYLLCEQLDSSVKVVLQGDGGDEIFAGYNRYRWLSQAKRIALLASLVNGTGLRQLVSSRFARYGRVLDAFSRQGAERLALLLTEETITNSPLRVLSQVARREIEKSDPFARYRSVFEQLDTSDQVQQMLYTDCQIILPDVFLPKVDRATMAHGIEVRVPFLDTELTNYVMPLSAKLKLYKRQQKGLLKEALRGVLPDSILFGKKTGFSVPYKAWIAGELGDWLSALLDTSAVQETGLFDQATVRAMLRRHRAGDGNEGFLLYKTLILALWIERSRVSV